MNKTKYRFKTREEAEDYFEKNINSNSNNGNDEWVAARDNWVDENSHLIEEVDVENRAYKEEQEK